MASAKEKPLYDAPADYEDDYYLWVYQQVELLRLGRFRELDLPNLIEEVEDMGRSLWRSFESHYRVLLIHLLKWEHQPHRRTRSWLVSIGRERRNLDREERDNTTLRNEARNLLEEAYRAARREAAEETGLPIATFPSECPYRLEQVRDEEWLPGPDSPSAPSLPPLDD